MSETLSCYRWKREGCEDSFWSTYPGAAEQYDNHEVTMLFWEAINE